MPVQSESQCEILSAYILKMPGAIIETKLSHGV
jgi:hypothetical protein